MVKKHFFIKNALRPVTSKAWAWHEPKQHRVGGGIKSGENVIICDLDKRAA